MNAFKKQELSEVIEVDLSRDEDSVTSLAYAQSTDLWATAFAGINSSTKEQKEGNNQHLRSFLLEYPPKRKPSATGGDAPQGEKPPEYAGKTKALGRVSYFTPTTTAKPETFQRVLRLSKKRKDNGPRVGAVATGLAPEGEIVIFAADTNLPSSNDIRGRIKLGEKEEAADLDLAAIVEDEDASNFLIAYCTEFDVYTTTRNFNYNRSEKCESLCIHSTPHPDVFAGSKARPKFRSLRFLTPSLLLLLQNLPNGTGAELLLMQTSGTILLRKRLHKKIKSGTALTVCSLPFTTPAPKSEPSVQHAIAVAGADTSITIITLDTPPSAPYPPAGKSLKFKQQELIKNDHPTSITSLAFSSHTPPTTPWVSTPAQYLKLASTSIANTVLVHTFPLFPYPPPPKNPHEDAKPASGYLLAPPPHRRETARETLFSLMMACLAIALSAFALQAFSEIRGVSPEVLGAKGWLSGSWYDALVAPNIYGTATPQEVFDNFVSRGGVRKKAPAVASSVSTALEGAGSSVSSAAGEASAGVAVGLRELVKSRDRGGDTEDEGNDGNAIVVHHHASSGEEGDSNIDSPTLGKGELSAVLHPEEIIQQRHKGARKWEDLASHEKEAWKRRLVDAGQWTVEEGEIVLKGVFFSGLAGAVGAAVHAGL